VFLNKQVFKQFYTLLEIKLMPGQINIYFSTFERLAIKSCIISVLGCLITIAAYGNDIVFEPPFSADSYSSSAVFYQGNFGEGIAIDLTDADMAFGMINQQVFTAAHRVGGKCMVQTDTIFHGFSVPQSGIYESGIYEITFSGVVSGQLQAAGFTYYLGVGKSAFKLELQGKVEGLNFAKTKLYETDLGWGCFVNDVVIQESILSVLNYFSGGTAEIIGLMDTMIDTMIDNIIPVKSWDANDFSIGFSTYLEQDQQYILEFSSKAKIGSIALGIAEQVAFEDVDITLNEIRISPTGQASNHAPATPQTIYPAPGQTDIDPNVTLESSSFSDPDGDSHASSRWQVAQDSGFGNMVLDSGETIASRTFQVPQDVLDNDDSYYWRVQYKDSRNGWSNWSAPADFNTVLSSHIAGYVKDAEDFNGINATVYVVKSDESMIVEDWGTDTPSGIFGIPVPEGQYYLLITAGGCVNDKTYSFELTRVPETGVIPLGPGEVNNVGDIYIEDVPDLREEEFEITNGPFHWGDEVMISHTCKNIGTEGAAHVKVKFYISSDRLIQQYDTTLGQHECPLLGPGMSWDGLISLNLPSNPPDDFNDAGIFYIGAIVDPDNNVNESDEFHNANRGFGIDKESLMIFNDSDLTSNGVTDLKDFAILAGKWLTNCTEPGWCDGADFNEDGLVDYYELSILADNWLDKLYTFEDTGSITLSGGVKALALDGNLLLAGADCNLVSIDMSNADNPFVLDEIILDGDIRDIVIDDNIAYTAIDQPGLTGADILEVVDIAAGGQLSVIESFQSEEHSSFLDIDISGNYAYIADHWNGMRILDLEDPCNIQQVTTYGLTSYEHGVAAGAEPFVYVSSGDKNGGRLTSVDASNPDAPFQAGACSTQAYPTVILFSLPLQTKDLSLFL